MARKRKKLPSINIITGEPVKPYKAPKKGAKKKPPSVTSKRN